MHLLQENMTVFIASSMYLNYYKVCLLSNVLTNKELTCTVNQLEGLIRNEHLYEAHIKFTGFMMAIFPKVSDMLVYIFVTVSVT